MECISRATAQVETQRPGFACGPVHMGLAVEKVALGQVFPELFRFQTINIIPLCLSTLKCHLRK
jgi:hypothetical protein